MLKFNTSNMNIAQFSLLNHIFNNVKQIKSV